MAMGIATTRKPIVMPTNTNCFRLIASAKISAGSVIKGLGLRPAGYGLMQYLLLITALHEAAVKQYDL
jgi:hypothetical protein